MRVAPSPRTSLPHLPFEKTNFLLAAARRASCFFPIVASAGSSASFRLSNQHGGHNMPPCSQAGLLHVLAWHLRRRRALAAIVSGSVVPDHPTRRRFASHAVGRPAIILGPSSTCDSKYLCPTRRPATHCPALTPSAFGQPSVNLSPAPAPSLRQDLRGGRPHLLFLPGTAIHGQPPTNDGTNDGTYAPSSGY